MSVGLTPTDEEIPALLATAPKDRRRRPVHSRRRAPGHLCLSSTFWHPDYAVDEVTVNTTTDGSLTPGLRAFEITPVKPTFTHTLEPARPVQGRVTDKATGKPLAGLLVEMIPMRRHGGMPFYARTDADGRYRVSGHAAPGPISRPSTRRPIPVTWPPAIGNRTGRPARSSSRRTSPSTRDGSCTDRSSTPTPSGRSPAPPSSINPSQAIPTTAITTFGTRS